MSDDFKNNYEGSSYEETDVGSLNFDIEEVRNNKLLYSFFSFTTQVPTTFPLIYLFA